MFCTVKLLVKCTEVTTNLTIFDAPLETLVFVAYKSYPQDLFPYW